MREKNLRWLWLTLLIYYPGYEIMTTQQKKKNTKNNEAKDLIAKYQMMNFKKNQFLIKYCIVKR